MFCYVQKAPDADALAEVRKALLVAGQTVDPAAAHLLTKASESLEALRLDCAALAAETRRLEAIQVCRPYMWFLGTWRQQLYAVDCAWSYPSVSTCKCQVRRHVT